MKGVSAKQIIIIPLKSLSIFFACITASPVPNGICWTTVSKSLVTSSISLLSFGITITYFVILGSDRGEAEQRRREQ